MGHFEKKSWWVVGFHVQSQGPVCDLPSEIGRVNPSPQAQGWEIPKFVGKHQLKNINMCLLQEANSNHSRLVQETNSNNSQTGNK